MEGRPAAVADMPRWVGRLEDRAARLVEDDEDWRYLEPGRLGSGKPA